jgi:Contractile injection system tube protein
MFNPIPSKLTIGSTDNRDLTVSAQYNPKEIDVAHQTNWKDYDAINGRVARDDNDIVDLEYTGTSPRVMSLELLFDGYELNRSVFGQIQVLRVMAAARDEFSNEPHLRRPHLCVVAWGEKDLRNFRCVIESLAVKYTMFGKGGEVLRATCAIKLKEARTPRPARR